VKCPYPDAHSRQNKACVLGMNIALQAHKLLVGTHECPAACACALQPGAETNSNTSRGSRSCAQRYATAIACHAQKGKGHSMQHTGW
jgi:hypothetical protein